MNWKTKRVLFIGIGLVAMTLIIGVSSASAVTQNCFTDVNTSHWFHDFVCWMYDNGLSAGYPDGSFRPNNNITRAETAVLAQRGYELAEANDNDALAGLTCTTDQIAKWNGSAWVCAADDTGATGVPAGAVMSFNLPACPVGWSEATDARGRALAGLPSGGTLAGTVGTGLSDLEDRGHTHDVDPASTGTTSSGSHSHFVDPPSTPSGSAGSHSHTVDPPSAFSSSDNHNHVWASLLGDESWSTYNSSGNSFQMVDWPSDGIGAEGSGYFPVSDDSSPTIIRFYYTANDSHNHSVNLFAFTSQSAGSHGHSVDIASFTSASAGSHTHSLDIPTTSSTTASTSDAVPYIQYLMCQKN
jgi:hypothetical protein